MNCMVDRKGARPETGRPLQVPKFEAAARLWALLLAMKILRQIIYETLVAKNQWEEALT
jgi:hypothetical protein